MELCVLVYGSSLLFQLKTGSLEGTNFRGSKYTIDQGTLSLVHHYDGEIEPTETPEVKDEKSNSYIIIIVCIAAGLSLLSAIAAAVSISTSACLYCQRRHTYNVPKQV